MERVLIIDDSKLILKMLSDVLEHEYEVFTLTNGTDAVGAAKAIDPSIILLDVVMPKLSGFEVIKNLKKNPETAEIPVIFLTSLSNEAEEARGFELGAADYITKPFSPSLVRARVRAHANLYLDKQQLNREREYNQVIIKITDDAFFDHDVINKTMKFSPNFSSRFGIPEELTNYPKSFIETGIIADDFREAFAAIVSDAEKGGIVGQGHEMHFKLPDGELVWYSLHYNVIRSGSGKPVRVVGKISDITKQKEQLSELVERAETDPLTKLFNKAETRRRIEKMLLSGTPDTNSALIIIDIDNFKGVNDNLGHQFGDSVIIDIADKIKRLFRGSDVVGRIGGDEFIVFMQNFGSLNIVEAKLAELTLNLRHTYIGENSEYRVSGSIGVAISPLHGTSFDELYKLSDIALYESKHKGKDCATVYHDEMQHETMERNTPIEDAERFVASFFASDPVYNAFQMLYETKDMPTSIRMVLGIIGKKYKVDRCYIFEHNDDNMTMDKTYEWQTPDLPSDTSKSLHEIPFSEMDNLFALYGPEGVLSCNDLSHLDDVSRSVFEGSGVKSFLHCAMYDGGKIKGFIGFDDCGKERVWRGEEVAVLSYISRILSIFIMKKQISNELYKSYQNYTQMLDNLNGYVYVINRDTHEMLYLNNAMKRLGVKMGDRCHKATFFSDTPCEECHVKKLGENTPFADREVFAPALDKWVNSAASIVKWIGVENAALICCHDISKFK